MRRSTRPRALRGGPAPDGSTTALSFATDVAANIFAVLFVALVIAAAGTVTAPPPPAEVQTVASWRERHPLDAAALVRLLHRRQAGGPGLILDLTLAGLRIVDADGVWFLPWEDAARINSELSQRLGRGPQPIALFVFAPRGYALVSRTIGPVTVDEMSPPAALRRCPPPKENDFGCLDGDDWSAGFASLQGRSLSEDAFRVELARLLAAEMTRRSSGLADGRPNVASSGARDAPSSGDGIADRRPVLSFGRAMGWLFAVLVFIGAEILTSRRRRLFKT